ncbi:MAG TPA: hypothetical protein PKE30_17045 [Niabella sp.]|nr:hypothetical protein [Niabella sp.]
MKYPLSIYAILLFSFISLNFQCGKDKELLPAESEEPQIFEMLLDIDPVKKKYTIGDTIWIDTNLPHKMLSDVKDHTKILVDTVRYNVPFIFRVLTTQTLVPDGGFCEFINPQQLQLATSSGYYDPRYNVYWNYNTGTIQNFGCNENQYKFKIGIRLNTKGAFYIGISGSQLTSCVNNENAHQNRYLLFKFNAADVNQDVYNNLPKLSQNNPYWIGFDVTSLNDKKAFIVDVE